MDRVSHTYSLDQLVDPHYIGPNQAVTGDEGGVRHPALEMQIKYDPARLRLAGLRALNGALVQYDANVPGVVGIALASAHPMAGGGVAPVALDFEQRRSGRRAAPQLFSASVDDVSAAVIAPE